MSDAIDEYWSLDIPGLTADQARSLTDRLGSEFDPIPVDPRHFLTRSYDRASVEILPRSLRTALDVGALPKNDVLGAQGLLEDCEDWLQQAAG